MLEPYGIQRNIVYPENTRRESEVFFFRKKSMKKWEAKWRSFSLSELFYWSNTVRWKDMIIVREKRILHPPCVYSQGGLYFSGSHMAPASWIWAYWFHRGEENHWDHSLTSAAWVRNIGFEDWKIQSHEYSRCIPTRWASGMDHALLLWANALWLYRSHSHSRGSRSIDSLSEMRSHESGDDRTK